jgi:hypothetical protein
VANCQAFSSMSLSSKIASRWMPVFFPLGEARAACQVLFRGFEIVVLARSASRRIVKCEDAAQRSPRPPAKHSSAPGTPPLLPPPSCLSRLIHCDDIVHNLGFPPAVARICCSSTSASRCGGEREREISLEHCYKLSPRILGARFGCEPTSVIT